MNSNAVTVVDLFAGAGGLSTGIAQACEDLGLALGEDVELHAVNHWDPAIATHEANHPWAEHYHARVEELYPPDVVEAGTVTLLAGGPECTHFSAARGGKPVSDQKRASAWHVLDWIEKLRPEHVLLENVPEFRKWGPIDDDGQPTKDGTIFERWVGMLEALGYSVVWDEDAQNYGVVLNAADYGDPQSRERLFVLASRSKLPTAPSPTHSDAVDDLPDRRPAADIIDWSDLGESLWTRDLENPRVSPLAENTMARIAEGIRRHCSDRLAPFADAVESIGPDRLRELREWVVPVQFADVVAAAVDEPFLVCTSGGVGSLARPFVIGQHTASQPKTAAGNPAPTVTTTSRGISLCNPEAFCLRQQSGGVPVPVDGPLSTVAAGGAIGLSVVESRTLVKPRNGSRGDLHSNALYPAEAQPLHTVTAKNHDGHLLSPYLCPLYRERVGQAPRTRSLDRPLMTVPSSKSPAALSVPFLVQYYGNSETTPLSDPVPTVPTKDRFALAVPEAWPWGLDVRYRMLQPDELKQAQGFPSDYEITGTSKQCQTAQIGNAVPVQLARSLARHLLADETPSLTSYGGGISGQVDVEVPPYEEVASDD